jgi:hypothetical protein
MCTIQRESSDALVSFVKNSDIFKAMRDDIARGYVLPCLRRRQVHFYGWGARLFNFSARSVKTHVRYLGEHGGNYRELKNDELTFESYKSVRQRAETHKAVVVHEDSANARDAKEKELAEVAKIFSALSITRAATQHNDPSLIDVEARFGKIAARNMPAGMIDLVFLMPNRNLLFVEAKGVWNKGVQSTGKASVETQVGIYEQHIKQDGVLEALNRSMQFQSTLLDKSFGPAIGIFPRVPILLLDPSKPQLEIGPKNSWLSDRLEEAGDWSVGSERPLVIDGRQDPAEAIKSFVAKFGTSKTD